MQQRYCKRWYFGWNIVIVSSIITLLTVGTRLGIGPFFKPILNDLGMSRTLLSMIVAISMLVYGIGMPIAGKLVDKYGTRFVLLVGLVIVVISILWTVYTYDPFSFFIAYGVLLSFGLSFISPIAVTPLVSRWFTRQRGKALFYLSTGAMGGVAIMTPIFSLLIQMMDWRNTLLLLAALFILIIIPSVLFVIRDNAPADTDLLPGQIIENQSANTFAMITLDGWLDALKTRPFWQISFGLFVCGFSMNLLGSHGVPMLTDHGFKDITASFGIGLIGIVAMFSTVFLGEISDRLPRRNILSLIYFIRGLGFFSLVLIVMPWQLYLVSAVGGLVWAGSTALSSTILGDVYGVRWVGILYGWSYFIHQIGGAIGSFLAGWGYELSGTHIFSFGTAAVLLVLASIVSLQLPTQFHVIKTVRSERNI